MSGQTHYNIGYSTIADFITVYCILLMILDLQEVKRNQAHFMNAMIAIFFFIAMPFDQST